MAGERLTRIEQRESDENIWSFATQLQGKYGWIFILAQISQPVLMQMSSKIVHCIRNLYNNAAIQN